MSTSTYPIQVLKESMDHKGGTKSYHFLMLTADDGRTILIFRYGKKGAFGQFMVEQHPTRASAKMAYDKKRNEKRGGGYQSVSNDAYVLENETELRRILHPAYLPTFGADNLRFLDPNFDVTGVRANKIDTRDENGNPIDTTKRADLSSFEDEERRKREEAEKADYDRMASLPTFGMF